MHSQHKEIINIFEIQIIYLEQIPNKMLKICQESKPAPIKTFEIQNKTQTPTPQPYYKIDLPYYGRLALLNSSSRYSYWYLHWFTAVNGGSCDGSGVNTPRGLLHTQDMLQQRASVDLEVRLKPFIDA